MAHYDELFGDYKPPTRLEKAANALRRAGHAIAMVPGFGLFGSPLTALAALADAANGYLNKSFASGTKNLIAGAADTGVTFFAGWAMSHTVINWVTGLATGDSLGELARKGTEGVLDSFISDEPVFPKKNPAVVAQRPLGMNPQMAAAIPAGVGYSPMMVERELMGGIPQTNPATGQILPPNYWADQQARRRGQEPAEARQMWMQSNFEEAQALRNLNQLPQQVGTS